MTAPAEVVALRDYEAEPAALLAQLEARVKQLEKRLAQGEKDLRRHQRHLHGLEMTTRGTHHSLMFLALRIRWDLGDIPDAGREWVAAQQKWLGE